MYACMVHGAIVYTLCSKEVSRQLNPLHLFLGRGRVWEQDWNDVHVYAAGLTFLSGSGVLRILRVLRALRSLKSISALRGLQIVVHTVIHSVPGQLVVHTGKLVVHNGQLVVHTGKLVVHTGQLVVHTGKLVVHTGQLVVS